VIVLAGASPPALRAEMPRAVTPAQRAAQLTWLLKGHLKNVQIAYLRAGAMLARIRDEKLYRALKYEDMESYAADRLGLQRSSLFRYLQVYDWVRGSHREWLAKHPKGFIPELSDAQALMWIEERLNDSHLDPATRGELEAFRRTALAGKLSKREIEEFRKRGKKRHDTTRALAASILALRRRAAALPNLPPEVLQDLDSALARLKSASGALGRAIGRGNAGWIRLPAIAKKSPPGRIQLVVATGVVSSS